MIKERTLGMFIWVFLFWSILPLYMAMIFGHLWRVGSGKLVAGAVLCEASQRNVQRFKGYEKLNISTSLCKTQALLHFPDCALS